MFNPEKYTRDIDNVQDAKNIDDKNTSSFVGRSVVNKGVVGLNLRTLVGHSSYWKNILYHRFQDVDNRLGKPLSSISWIS